MTIAMAFEPGIHPDLSPGSPSWARSSSILLLFEGALDTEMDFDHVFRVVRDTTRSALGLERTGLGLALSDLPPSLGAYWPVTGI